MPCYEVVGHDRKSPVCESAENLADAKRVQANLAATGKFEFVLIRRYFVNRFGHNRCQVLHRSTWRKPE